MTATIDDAYKALQQILADTNLDNIQNESDTRLKIVDRILIECLFWNRDSIFTEESVFPGYIDYSCRIHDHSKLVVEAKKASGSLPISESSKPTSAYKLNGPAFGPGAKDAIKQAMGYCGRINTELAAVTNGLQWIVFRGTRPGEGVDSFEGYGITFNGLSEVSDNFDLFFSLLSRSSVAKYSYRPHFLKAENRPSRSVQFARALRTEASARRVHPGPLASDIDKIGKVFFRQISDSDNMQMLHACFVESDESRSADEVLLRLSEELVQTIGSLDTSSSSELVGALRTAHEVSASDFILLIGLKGSGKSTFIDRFFSKIVPSDLRDSCLVIRADMRVFDRDSESLEKWLATTLLAHAEKQLYPDYMSYSEMQGIFYDEYTRWRVGPYEHLYKSDKEAFKTEFGKHIESWRSNDPAKVLHLILDRCVKQRKRLPVVVIDNADQFPIQVQESAFQFARALFERSMSLVLMPITDQTSWNLAREGALRSFDNRSFYLPVPDPHRILEKRVEFLSEHVASSRSGAKARKSGLAPMGKALTLQLEDVESFVKTVEAALIGSPRTGRLLADLSNNDMRRMLEGARQIISSPHTKLDDLLSTYVAKRTVTVPDDRIITALVRGNRDIYVPAPSVLVRDIFSATPHDFETTPLLATRMLEWLSNRVATGDSNPAQLGPAYSTTEALISAISVLGIPTLVSEACLSQLLQWGLVVGYDPTVTDLASVDKVTISPSGRRHLEWSKISPFYLNCMAEVHLILDPDTYRTMSESYVENSFDPTIVRAFKDYLVKEDRLYISVPRNDDWSAQRDLYDCYIK